MGKRYFIYFFAAFVAMTSGPTTAGSTTSDPTTAGSTTSDLTTAGSTTTSQPGQYQANKITIFSVVLRILGCNQGAC